MRLEDVRNGIVHSYEGETKHDCLKALADDLLNTPYLRTLEDVSNLMRDNVNPMVSDEEIAVMVYETVTKAFGYTFEWKGEEA